jgi:diguanylate cyclase (GGDEF)-like protein
VLVAEDDADCRDSLGEAVRGLGYSCSTARDGVEAWEMHQTDRADLVLSDWNMPRMDGVDLCRKIRGDDSDERYTHFIFITANTDKAHFLDGMHAGADDYLAKPVDLDDLETHLAAAKRVVLLHRELAEHNARLRHDSERARTEARVDPLTLLFNRLALEEDLEVITARAARYGHAYCAALLDVDGFKAYNDSFGHIAGDDVLRRVARTIHEQLRRGDVAYRYGGDEFLVILPEQSLVQAAVGMERVRLGIERLAIPHAPSAALPLVTVSVGVSLLAAESPETWLRCADTALYSSKALGRNRVMKGVTL